jgi:mRNA interferase RelE/StbE
MPGNKLFKIEYLDVVVKKDIPELPKIIKTAVKKAIEERLMHDPVGFGKPLRFSLKGHRRLRIGDYRVVFRIEAENAKVVIIAIKHPKNIYKEF